MSCLYQLVKNESRYAIGFVSLTSKQASLPEFEEYPLPLQ